MKKRGKPDDYVMAEEGLVVRDGMMTCSPQQEGQNHVTVMLPFISEELLLNHPTVT